MTAVLVAWAVSAPLLAVIVGHRFAGRSVVATVLEVTASPRVRTGAVVVLALTVCVAWALITRGHIPTWHGLVEVPA